MVKYKLNKGSAALSLIFFALSSEVRRGILAQLSKQGATAQELAAPHDVSLPAISKHLKVLEEAKLVTRRVEGRTHNFTLNVGAIETAEEWLELHRHFWEGSLKRLEEFVMKDKPKSKRKSND